MKKDYIMLVSLLTSLRPWDDNALTTVHGTPADASSGYTLIEEYLVKKYLAEREFNTPMNNSKYHTRLSLPKRAGQFIKLTRRLKLRSPEVATELAEPESRASLGYEQILVPIEFHEDAIGIGTIAAATSWIDLAKDAKELTFEAIARYSNRYIQATFVKGRFKPGHRNTSGATTGTTPYFHFWTTAEATVTLYGNSFTFVPAPNYWGGDATNINDLAATDYATMDDFRKMRTRLRNAGARTIGGKFIAVISESTQADLERDDEYYAAAIRSFAAGTKGLVDGQLADYAGFIWVIEDEPWIVEGGTAIGGTGNGFALDTTGTVHYSHIFGQDAFGRMTLGGFSSSKPKFKVQDITTTGKLTTMGYLIAFQSVILNATWCCNLIAPVRDSGANGS